MVLSTVLCCSPRARHLTDVWVDWEESALAKPFPTVACSRPKGVDMIHGSNQWVTVLVGEGDVWFPNRQVKKCLVD